MRSSSSGKTDPDVVTMDITMPHMDGIECVERIVAIKPDVLILVISALADKATAVEAMEKGANGFLNKPFTDRQLNDALEELLGRALTAMFDEHEIRTFVYGTTRYFEVSAQQPATVGSPYPRHARRTRDRRVHRRSST